MIRVPLPRAHHLVLAAAGTAALLLAATPAAADQIEVEGQPMSGKVLKATAKGLEVETTYGKGNVLVDYAKVTALRTDLPFVILHGDDGEVAGQLLGVRDGALLIGSDVDSATAVPVAMLHDSVSQEEFEDSRLLQLRSALRYWDAHYDLSFAATDATTNTLSLSTGFEIERRKRPTRFLTTGSYRYATTDDPGDDPSGKETIQNELIGLLRGEYDLNSRLYAFAAAFAEYDEDESLSLRFAPKLGPGVRIIDTETQKWSADIGGAWVYEDFFGDEDNSYFAISFGTNASLTLPFGSTLTIRGDYLPAVDEWVRNYMLRGSVTLLFPMTDWLSFRTGVVEQYTNQPAEDSDRNSLTGTAGLALVF